MFSREHQQTVLKPMIDQMQALLVGFGVPNAVAEIDSVRQQLRLAESAGYLCAGLPGAAKPVYILKHDTSACLHASNTESIPPGIPTPANFEVYHQPLRDNNDPTDLWCLNDLGTGKSLTNQAFSRVLHASGTQVTGRGTSTSTPVRRVNNEHAEEFTIEPVPVPVTTSPTRRAGSPTPAISTSSASGRMRWRSSGSTSRRAAGQGSTRSSPGPTSTSTDPRIVDHRVATVVVDDENLLLVAAPRTS